MRIIFITGVSTGIGRAALAHYINKNYHVIGTVRSSQDKEILEKEFPKNTNFLCFDVRDSEKMESEILGILPFIKQHGLAALINNAGIAVAGPLQYIPEDDFEKQIDVNVKSVRRITNHLLPYLGMNHSYPPGRIINISSVSGLIVSPFMGAYSVSKYALEAMSDAYRRELYGFGIKVIVIEPGPIKTEIWDKNKGTLKPFENTEYGSMLKNADDIMDNANATGLPVDAVIKYLDLALEKKNPKTRYIVHKNTFLIKLIAKIIPDTWVDKMAYKTLSKGEKHRMV
ncbi:MAG: SDR family NAD(P)-dependent oxidoreductase [Saprospiraceae bacterium]